MTELGTVPGLGRPTRRDLDGWALLLGARNDAEAAAAVRSVCSRINDASCELFDARRQFLDSPGDEVAELLDKAGVAAEMAVNALLELRRCFERHERGGW